MLSVHPFQAVNAGLRITDHPVPRLGAAELEVAEANLTAWGGHPPLFRHFLAAGLAADPDADLHQLAAVAGWRSGALNLRFEALRLLPALPARAVAAALGFSIAEVADFVELQQLDPYWWPRRAAVGGNVLRAGGFAGLGGSWMEPPGQAGRGAVTGRWVVRTGATWWQLDADVFGTVITELEREPDCGPDTDSSGVQIMLAPASYVVSLIVPAEATGGGW